MIKRNDIIAVIFIAALSIVSIYYAYRYVGARAGRFTIAGVGVIVYLIIRDFRNRKKQQKEEELKKSGGRVVMSTSKDRKNRIDIGNIAHKSTKDKNLYVNQSRDDDETADGQQAPSEEEE